MPAFSSGDVSTNPINLWGRPAPGGNEYFTDVRGDIGEFEGITAWLARRGRLPQDRGWAFGIMVTPAQLTLVSSRTQGGDIIITEEAAHMTGMPRINTVTQALVNTILARLSRPGTDSDEVIPDRDVTTNTQVMDAILPALHYPSTQWLNISTPSTRTDDLFTRHMRRSLMNAFRPTGFTMKPWVE